MVESAGYTAPFADMNGHSSELLARSVRIAINKDWNPFTQKIALLKQRMFAWNATGTC